MINLITIYTVGIVFSLMVFNELYEDILKSVFMALLFPAFWFVIIAVITGKKLKKLLG